jgi:putative ABC transport system permease protein
VIVLDLRRTLAGLRAAPLRALLTLLGVMLSTSSFVLLISLVEGGAERLNAAEQRVNERDLLVVNAKPAPHGAEHRTSRPLSRRDARVLDDATLINGVGVAGEQRKQATAKLGGRTQPVSLVSATPGALQLYRLEIARGRFFSPSDLAERRRVCVVGHEIWQKLLEGKPELTREIEIAGVLWSLVGVLKDKPGLGSSDSTNVWNRKVLVPESSFDLAYNPEQHADQLYLRAPDADDTTLNALQAVTNSTLLRLHHGVQNFDFAAPKDRQQAELIFAIVQILLVGTALISLLVGGINVMNVMLVTVTERTREIGIRRAVGASPRAIARQFLLEAVALTSVGGAAGVAIGAGLAALAALALDHLAGPWLLHIEPWAVLLGLGSSAATGLFFGFYPARRAAALDVIVALRSD